MRHFFFGKKECDTMANKIDERVFLDIDDVWIVPKRSDIVSRKDVVLIRDFKSRWHKERIMSGVPVIVSNMMVTGTLKMAQAMKNWNCWVAIDKFYCDDSFFNLCEDNMFFSIGESKDDYLKLQRYLDNREHMGKALINFEVAYCHRQKFIDKVKKIRERYPDIILMVGDVASPVATEELILSGADIVRFGCNFGSQCKTKHVTGVYVPSFTLAQEVVDAAHGVDGLACSDGGVKASGDVAKFMGTGVDFCMSSFLFAGTDECNGEIVEKNGKRYMKHFGSASQTALNIRNIDNEYRPVEGIESLIEVKGPVDGVMKQLFGGIRSSMSYVGAKTLKEFHKRCSFVKTK